MLQGVREVFLYGGGGHALRYEGGALSLFCKCDEGGGVVVMLWLYYEWPISCTRIVCLVWNSQFCSEKGVPDLRLPKNRLGYMMCVDDVFVYA